MKNLLVVALAMFVMVGCKKEDTAKKLWDKGGKWDVVFYEQDWDYSGETADDKKIANGGVMHFNQTGTGYLQLFFGNISDNKNFEYAQTETSLQITVGEKVTNYKMEWDGDEVVLSNKETETYMENGEEEELVVTTELKIKRL